MNERWSLDAFPSRRRFVVGSVAVGLGMGLPLQAMAQASGAVDAGSVIIPGALPDLVYGDETAPVTVVEYTSLTCGFCADFHVGALPDFRRSHLDTGRARLVVREFPLDPRSLAGFMLARCLEGDRTLAMIDLLFQRQADWARAENGSAALFSIAQTAGMGRDEFVECLGDRALQGKIVAAQERGQSEFGVSGTPTFFVDGERHVGTLSAVELSALVDART